MENAFTSSHSGAMDVLDAMPIAETRELPIANPPAESRDTRGRLGGIDSIRALAACVVVLGHEGLFPVSAAHSSNALISLLARISGFLWNGPAAVIVFFIISGLCIHLPYRGERPLKPGFFFARRLIRIGVPVLLALLFSALVLKNPGGLNNVLWSIVCETIYYLLYPILLPLGRRFGWPMLIAFAYLLSFTLAFTHLSQLSIGNNGYDALGYSLTWLIGLPCWLLGCLLAETEKRFPALNPGRMMLLRAGFFFVMVALRIIKFHVHAALASNAITLNLFALLAFLWLGFEIAYFKQTKPSKLFEWMGEWSYSLYLMHPLAEATLLWLGLSALRSSQAEALHLLVVGSSFMLAYAFHLLAERPSHKLAVMISRSVKA